MPLFSLNKQLVFPPVDLAEPDGLLAIGGDLTPERLLLAYREGIFPWYHGEQILWWSPDPRFVLFPNKLKVSRTMRRLLKRNEFEFSVNKNFSQVIRYCKEMKRAGQDGTWITEEMESAYIKLHEAGYAHSAEAWQDGNLVGGVYGLRLGKIFFGESMFSRISNASKFVFIRYIELLNQEKVALIDCQVYTEHLESLVATMIPRKEFLNLLEQNRET